MRTAIWNLRRSSVQQFARTLLIVVCVLLSAVPQTSLASLVILLYHNQALYIGSDSAVTSLETGKRIGSVQKDLQDCRKLLRRHDRICHLLN